MKKTDKKQSEYIKSPLNYTGSKYKLLPQLLPLFPKKIYQFIDMCCGGCNVGINVPAIKHYYVDNNLHVINILKWIRDRPKEQLLSSIDKKYEIWKLSNKKEFIEFRDYVNYHDYRNNIYERALDIYVLLTCSYNHQIRFNHEGKFNTSYGQRRFNNNIRKNFGLFKDKLDTQISEFIGCDFNQFPYDIFENDFIYIDPPYLLATATYNERGNWVRQDEEELYLQLDKWHEKGYRWGLSNVLKHNDMVNTQLQEWLQLHSRDYVVYKLDGNYSNVASNKKSTNRKSKTQEIYVTNVKER